MLSHGGDTKVSINEKFSIFKFEYRVSSNESGERYSPEEIEEIENELRECVELYLSTIRKNLRR